MSALGWAVIDGGEIKVRTVSDTKRAAMVNWLVTERACFIYNAMTDQQIERLWFHHRGRAEIEHVTITRVHADAEHARTGDA